SDGLESGALVVKRARSVVSAGILPQSPAQRLRRASDHSLAIPEKRGCEGGMSNRTGVQMDPRFRGVTSGNVAPSFRGAVVFDGSIEDRAGPNRADVRGS